LLDAIRDAYALASAGWRMPMHGGFKTVRSIVDIPFVARQPRLEVTRERIRGVLRLPVSKPLALVSFGGYGVEGLPLDRVDCTPAWGVVDVAAGSLPGYRDGPVDPDVFRIPEPAIYSNGLRYDDLVRAVDVVITKPGYGIISDCVAGKTAMLYTSRGRFAEYDVLVAELPRYLRCGYIDGVDLKEGRWLAGLTALAAAPPPPETPRIDGARTVAGMIAARLAT
jgi:L-arabinokinase